MTRSRTRRKMKRACFISLGEFRRCAGGQLRFAHGAAPLPAIAPEKSLRKTDHKRGERDAPEVNRVERREQKEPRIEPPAFAIEQDRDQQLEQEKSKADADVNQGAAPDGLTNDVLATAEAIGDGD